MTQEEQDAILGRTLRAYKEAKNKLGALRTRTKEITSVARALASALEEDPAHILVGKGPMGSVRLANASYVYEADAATCLSPKAIEAHVAERAATERLVADLRQELVDQGHELKE
jgi:hypothetical protein